MLGQCGIPLDSNIRTVVVVAVGVKVRKDQGFNRRSC